jgi:hypothetical protein
MEFEKIEGMFNAEPDDNQLDPNTQKPGDDDPNDKPSDKKAEAKFTEEEVNRIVKDRLKREKEAREKAEEEARKREEGKYKELLEERERELEKLRKEAQDAKLDAKKTDLLSGAGYAPEQLAFARKNLEGETDEELAASLESLKAVFPPKTDEGIGFPNKGNGSRKPPKEADGYDAGRELAKRVLEKKRFK